MNKLQKKRYSWYLHNCKEQGLKPMNRVAWIAYIGGE